MSALPPLFFQSADGTWLQPIPIYLASIFGAFAPLFIGSLDVVLIYVVAAQLLKSRRVAAMAVLILLLFPAHAVFMRQASDAIYPVPFVLGWLVCLLAFLDRPRPWLLVAGGMALGVGIYTQPSAPIMMAAFVVVSLGALWFDGHRVPRFYVALLGGFAVPLLLMVPWFAMHSETYQETMGRWAIHKAHLRYPLDGVRAFLNWNTLALRASLYWEMFNPSFLLFREDSGAFSTRAPMLIPVAMLVILGVRTALTSARPAIAIVLLAGLAASPLAASTFGESHALHRALPMVVFLSLLGALGVQTVVEYLSIRR